MESVSEFEQAGLVVDRKECFKERNVQKREDLVEEDASYLPIGAEFDGSCEVDMGGSCEGSQAEVRESRNQATQDFSLL